MGVYRIRTAWLLAGVLAWVLLGAGGCTPGGGGGASRGGSGGGGAGGTLGAWRGPATPTEVRREPWSYTLATGQRVPGWVLTSSNYRLHTTIENPAIGERLVQTLEAALVSYREVFPTAPPTLTPMEAWVFAERSQWMDFTRRNTGSDARLYLQINRGGYTVGDWFVSYFTAERDTMSVTAHEGFHQFVARHFKGRLPPFLEEGLSCTFERVRLEEARGGGGGRGGVVRINRSINPQRAQSLRTVLERRAVWRLEELIELHAGRVVGQSGGRTEAFYSQSWAFARFLQEYDNGRYKARFDRWMADTVSGEMFDPTGTHRRAQPLWDPAAVRPIMEHYLQTDLATLQREFNEWCRYIAFDEFARQWANQ